MKSLTIFVEKLNTLSLRLREKQLNFSQKYAIKAKSVAVKPIPTFVLNRE